MDALYAALAEGRPAIDALRAAKLATIRQGRPQSLWAAFELVGDPITVVPLEPTHRVRRTWWAVGGLGVIALLTMARLRRIRLARR